MGHLALRNRDGRERKGESSEAQPASDLLPGGESSMKGAAQADKEGALKREFKEEASGQQKQKTSY